MTDYPFDIATNFAGLDIFSRMLRGQCITAGLLTITDVEVRRKANPTDVVFVNTGTLTAPEITTLDGIVAAYAEASGQVNGGDDTPSRTWGGPHPARKLVKSQDVTFFEAGHGYAFGGSGSSADLTVGDDRPASVQLVTNGAGADATLRNNSIAGAPFDLTKNYLVMVYRFANQANLDVLSIFIGTDSLANFYRPEFANSQAQPFNNDGEWAHRIINPNVDEAGTGGSPDDAMLASIDAIQIRMADDATGTVTIEIQEFYLAPKPSKEYFAICMDDGRESVFTLAKPEMDVYGDVGTAFAIKKAIGLGGRMTFAQLNSLNNLGWDISPHAYSSEVHAEGITDLGEAEVERDFRNSRDWHFENRFRGSGVYAAPHGEQHIESNDFGQDVDRRALVRQYFSCARTTHRTGMESLPFADPYRIIPNYVTFDRNVSDVIDSVNAWLDAGSFPVLLFHDFVSGTAVSGEYNIDDFAAILAAIHARPGNPQCITMSRALFDDFERVDTSGAAGAALLIEARTRTTDLFSVSTTPKLIDFDQVDKAIDSSYFTYSAGVWTAQKSFTVKVSAQYTQEWSAGTEPSGRMDIVLNGSVAEGVVRQNVYSSLLQVCALSGMATFDVVATDTIEVYALTLAGTVILTKDTMKVTLEPQETS